MKLEQIQQLINELPSNERGNLSDTYHTFNELYDMRLALTAKLFNMAYQQLFLIAELTDRKINDVLESFKSDGMYLYKSKNHSDGIPVWDNWFIVVANFGEGQISFHYEMKDWDLFQIEEIDIPPAYDNHTTQDVINRLKQV